MIIEKQPISIDVLKEKYLKNGEENELDIFKRVSQSLSSVEQENAKKWEKIFYKNMMAGGIGAGRIMSSGGTDIQATLINCFVQPVGDAIQGIDEKGRPGIYEALKYAAETMRRGGGVGYDFSNIRPKNAKVKGTQSFASGPCSYINVFDQSCSTVESAGSRRGAQMGVLKINHPDIVEFINAKRTVGRWNNFNVSVAVSNAFMDAVHYNKNWPLVHEAEPSDELIKNGAYKREDGLWVYSTVKAADLWETIMQSTYNYSEPGILFLDNINQDNNLNYCEVIDATNPCAEQPLPAYGCCDLGPIILTKFVSNPFGISPTFDFKSFEEVVKVQVRMLDNVLDVTFWPLEEQKTEAMNKRRIGVGFTGLGNTLTMMKIKYNSEEGRNFAAKVAEIMRNTAYRASVELAVEKGSFPLFDADKYLKDGTFASRLPESIKKEIKEKGIRNSHLLSIAPTGTISLAFADNASNGIEPAFSWTYTRKKREQDGTTSEYQVEDYAWRLFRSSGGDVNNLPDYFVSALEMTVEEHVSMLREVQPFIDTSISKTVNIPKDYPYEAFKNTYLDAWRAKLKGLATYRPNDILGSVLYITNEQPLSAQIQPTIDPMRQVIERRPNGPLDSITEKVEYWTTEGKKTLYIVVSFIKVEVDGKQRSRAIEFFMPVQNSESQQWITSSMRLLSLAARGGFLGRALQDMREVIWDKGNVRLGTYTKQDGTKVPMWHDSETAAIGYAIQNIIEQRENNYAKSDSNDMESNSTPIMSGKKCPDCGAHAVIKKDGCSYCTQCGYIGSCG